MRVRVEGVGVMEVDVPGNVRVGETFRFRAGGAATADAGGAAGRAAPTPPTAAGAGPAAAGTAELIEEEDGEPAKPGVSVQLIFLLTASIVSRSRPKYVILYPPLRIALLTSIPPQNAQTRVCRFSCRTLFMVQRLLYHREIKANKFLVAVHYAPTLLSRV
jgi:hypothetical protein